MTIKEIEEQSGMTRANIRFYESENLLTPKRTENGYRDYSKDDLSELLRIKLLRSLHVSLEDIKRLHNGEEELSELLHRQEESLSEDQKELSSAERVLKRLKADQTDYKRMDGRFYERLLARENENGAKEQGSFYDGLLDVIPAERIPLRRFFARMFDLTFYLTLWIVLFTLAGRVHYFVYLSSVFSKWLDVVCMTLLMLVLEPCFLSLFGTTPGKFLLSLRVVDEDGRKLRFKAAVKRTKKVLFYGLGCNVPLLNLFFMKKSYTACRNGEMLEWESQNEVTVKKKGLLPCILYAVGVGVLLFTANLAINRRPLPIQRGTLSASGFCDNFNFFRRYYGYDTLYYLTPDGTFAWKGQNVIVLESDQTKKSEFFTFLEENGQLSEVRYTAQIKNNVFYMPDYSSELLFSMLSFLGAQEGFRYSKDETKHIYETLLKNTNRDFTFSAYGVSVSCQVFFQGYEEDSFTYVNGNSFELPKKGSYGYLWKNSEENVFSVTLTMKKE